VPSPNSKGPYHRAPRLAGNYRGSFGRFEKDEGYHRRSECRRAKGVNWSDVQRVVMVKVRERTAFRSFLDEIENETARTALNQKSMFVTLKVLAILVGIMGIVVVVTTILRILGVGVGFRLSENRYGSEVNLKTCLWLLGLLLVLEAVLLFLLQSTRFRSKF
ncbi:MAG: hypothetical protein ACRDRT_07630, partial [Pseudonocardiaceae bacterium]